MSSITYTGACLCSAVQYELSGDKKDMRGVTACHCQQCRRWSGHHWASVHAPKSDLTITVGEESIGWFASSSKAKRGFCKTCGSALFWHGFGYPSLADQIDVSAGSLDNSGDMKIRRHIFCKFKGNYYKIKDGADNFDTFPHTNANP